MIVFRNLSIFSVNADAVVNPVNCVGVMGRGLAFEIKRKMPEECFLRYQADCRTGKLSPGFCTTYRYNGITIINMPTKINWRYPSKLDWIRQDLYWLRDNWDALGIKAVTMPAIGCGLGGLNRSDVFELIREILKDVNGTVYICDPEGLPAK